PLGDAAGDASGGAVARLGGGDVGGGGPGPALRPGRGDPRLGGLGHLGARLPEGGAGGRSWGLRRSVSIPTMADPVLLAPGVWRLPTLGRSAVNSFALLGADGGVTLVDAGLRGAPRRLVRRLAAIGTRPDQVRCIVATHAHFDHVGDAP